MANLERQSVSCRAGEHAQARLMIVAAYRYDPSRLYVRQGTALLPFGCAEFHPLPLAPAPRAVWAGAGGCDDAAQAFAGDWRSEPKVKQPCPEHKSSDP